jgi:hypothetical protein
LGRGIVVDVLPKQPARTRFGHGHGFSC